MHLTVEGQGRGSIRGSTSRGPSHAMDPRIHRVDPENIGIGLLPMPWQQVERLDAATITQRVRVSAGIRLELVGPCSGGQVGAAYVRWPDGHLAVLKWHPDIGLTDLQRGPLTIVDVLRSIGYPAQSTELAVRVGSGVVTVQELLPGTEISYLDQALLDQALALNRLHLGILAARPEIEPMKLYLTSDGDVVQLLDSFPNEILLPAWAHMSLRMVDWAIRHFTTADVDHWPDLAEQGRPG